MIGPRTRLSVIVPAHQAAGQIGLCLEALRASDLPRDLWEIIVVNDGSTDETAEIASRFADEVLTLPGKPRGPSYARNRGAEIAAGEILAFVDADVCVHRGTLRQFLDSFDQEPGLGAVFGSYDDDPPGSGVASKYRNLLHHYVHQKNPGEAETFWAGCGAVSRGVFWEVGMFDEWHFWEPQVEDIELGRRIRRHGYRILLRPEIQAKHLKRWTLRGIISTDFGKRGVPWMRLIVHEGATEGGSTLNLRPVEKVCTALAGLGVLAIPAVVLWSMVWLVLPGVAVVTIVGTHLDFYGLIRRRCGWATALASMPLHAAYYAGNAASGVWGRLTHEMVGPPQPPPDVAAFEELGFDTWPPVPTRPKESVWHPDER